MVSPETFIPLVFALAAIFYALLGLYAWRRRPAAGVVSFAWVMLAMSFWAFTYALEIFFPRLETKLLILNIEYIGILCLPVFMFFFALDYTGRSHLLTPRNRTLTWLIPAAILLLVWTNPLHHLMWSREGTTRLGALQLLNIQFEIGFQLQLGFSFIAVITAGFILTMEFLQRPGSLRIHISFVILGIFISIGSAASFFIGASALQGVDFTPLFFLPTAIGLAWVTLQYRLSGILSLEHLTVLKNMKDGVIVLNEQNRILYINPVTENLLNRKEDEVIGQPFEQVAAHLSSILPNLIQSGENHKEIQISLEDGEKIFETALSSIQTPQSNKVNTVITLHDVTEHKEKQQELSRHSAIMSAISRAAEKFLKSADWEKNIPNVLKELGMAADVSRVYVVVNAQGEDKLIYSSMTYEWTAPGVPAAVDKPSIKNVAMPQAGFGRWVKALSKGKMIHGLVQDFPIEEAGLIRQLGSLSLAVAPLFVNTTWWGFLVFDELRHKRSWTSLELDAFQIAASIFGAAETHAQTSKKLISRQLGMSVLQDIVTVSLKAENVQEMANTVSVQLAKLIGADGCFLTLWEESTLRTIPVAAYGQLKDIYPTMSIPPGEKTFTRSALELERALIVEDVNNTPYASPAMTSRFSTKSALVLPLITRNKKLGSMLISFESHHHFEAEEVQISKQAAALIALALEKFQAVEDAKRRADTSEILRKAGMAITEKLEMEQVVLHILEQLHQVVPYDSASVQLLEGNELVIIGGRGWQDMGEVLGMRFPIPGDNPNSEVIRTGKPQAITEPWQIYSAFKQPPNDHIRSWMGVPLIAQNKVIGLLSIDRSTPEKFRDEDLKTAAEFSNQVALALENVRLFQETQTQALTDTLTGVHNRRGMYQLGEFEFQRSRRINRPFSLMILDIDHFKKVNDTYGHSVGDQVLQQIAKRCVQNSRATDLVIRFGGEEFIILLTETGMESARIIAERLRHSIMSQPFQTDTGNIDITSSIGIAEANKKDTLDKLIERADAALYQAKNTGRNKVMTSD